MGLTENQRDELIVDTNRQVKAINGKVVNHATLIEAIHEATTSLATVVTRHETDLYGDVEHAVIGMKPQLISTTKDITYFKTAIKVGAIVSSFAFSLIGYLFAKLVA